MNSLAIVGEERYVPEIYYYYQTPNIIVDELMPYINTMAGIYVGCFSFITV